MSTANLSTRSKSGSSTAEPLNAGRFAPSPTGPLHLGSLLAAAASYLDARSRERGWLVRIDDLDAQRNQPGADDLILEALEAHGLCWDGPVQRQSEHLDRYRAALDALSERGLVFYCRCSRRKLEGHDLYPGFCRAYHKPRPDCAVRIEVADAVVSFDDLVQGPQREALARTSGDFVIRRRDGFYAYQLATAVDDGQPEIERVVRGRDLLGETAKQILLMQLLELDPPEYAHVPTLVYPDGRKLSKQTAAPALDPRRAGGNLYRVLGLLGIELPDEAAGWTPAALLEHSLPRWRLESLPKGDVVCDPAGR